MEQTKAEYDKLNKSREDIEIQIKDLNEILTCNGNVGMDAKLVDNEGYPRNDIDVYAVRHARHDVIRLKNDLKEVMGKLEQKLYEIHDIARRSGQVTSNVEKNSQPDKSSLSPFLLVNEVAEEGPAAQAGIALGDLIKQFGSITLENFKGLKDIGNLVQHGKGTKIRVMVDRNGGDAVLELIPQNWKGRGLLGCNIVPIPPK